MQSQDYCLQEYALQEQDLHPVACKGMTIQPPSAAIKSEQRLWKICEDSISGNHSHKLALPGVRIPSDDFNSGVG